MNLEQAIEMFLDNQKLKGNSEKTIIFYQNHLKYLSEFLGLINIQDITLDDLNRYKIHVQDRKKQRLKQKKNNYLPQSLSTVTVATYIRAVRSLFNFLKNEGFTTLDMTKYPLPKQQKYSIDILSYEEIEKVLKAYNQNTLTGCRNKTILSLLLDCGLRRSEVITLKLVDVKFNQNIIIVTGKGNKRRQVPLGVQTKKLLYKYIYYYRPKEDIETGRVFLNIDRTPITENTIKLMFYRLKTKTGIKRLYPHLLRHTFATYYLINGGDSLTLQIILGHTTLKMVTKYIHIANTFILFEKKKNSLVDNLYKRQYH